MRRKLYWSVFAKSRLHKIFDFSNGLLGVSPVREDCQFGPLPGCEHH